MKLSISVNTVIFAAAVIFSAGCKKDYGNLNGATIESFLSNATQAELNNLVSGTESGMRNSMALYIDDVGTIGREGYHFATSEPRYVTDLLGASSGVLSGSNFYITSPWAARYRVIKNCNVLIQAAENSSYINAAQKAGYIGFAKMVKAYQLLLNLNLTDSNGIRLDVADPDHLGGIVSYTDGLAAIASLLDSAATDFTAGTISFSLAGFAGLNDAAGLKQVSNALSARVAVYQQHWSDALSFLGASFFGLNKDFTLGANHVYGTGTGDQLNTLFIPQNQTGEVRVAHPSYAADIETGDDRLGKATLRTTTASLSGSGLSSNRDVWVYRSSLAPLPIIRNEELILIYAEANIQNGNLTEGTNALNVIRNGHNLGNYGGPATKAALIDEMLKQRRYSLYFEGHRWIDMRRYDRLNELPLDRPDDDVWTKFPLPVTEQ